MKVFLGGMQASTVQGRYLQGRAMNSHNTFDKPHEVTPQTFTGAKLTSGGLEILAPKMSVVALEIS